MLVVLRGGISSRAHSLFLAIVFSLFASQLLCASAVADQTREGTLRVVQEDRFNGESVDPEYSLETESGTIGVVPTEIEEGASTGDTAEVTGSFEAGELVGGVNVTAQAEEEMSGAHKVLVLAVKFPGSPPPDSLESIREKIFTGTESVNSFYQEESYGAISFEGKLDPEGDIFGWFDIDPVEGCAPYTVQSEAEEVAEEEGISLKGYDHVVFVHTHMPCWWGGLAEIGGGWVNINGGIYSGTYTHEFGHNLGFHHANELHCTDEEGLPVVVSDDCTSEEYGDPFDVMGRGNAITRHNGAYRLEHVGIISSKNIETIETDGTYEVESALEQTEGITALRIPRFFNANHEVVDYYELEIRKQGGVFENVADTSMTGVSIRKVSWFRSRPTGFYTSLPQGKTFNDGSVSITTLSAGEGKATVEVDVPPGSDSKPPTAPGGLTATVLSEGLDGVDLDWEPSEDNFGVARYLVLRDGQEIGSSAETKFADYPRSSGLHAYVVYAEDEAGNRSLASESATVDVTAPFTIPPTNLFNFGGEGSSDGKFYAPGGITVDSSGSVWVTDRELNRVQKFNEKGEFLLKFGTTGSEAGKFKAPKGIATTPGGDLWIADSGNHRLQKFNSEGKWSAAFGTEGTGNGQFLNPVDVAIAPDGSIWVSDAGRDDIQKFDASGKFITKSKAGGSGDGQFSDPAGIATDASGNLWVADEGNDRFQELSPTGTFVAKFGGLGSAPGQFDEPHDVVVKSNGTLLVADGYNNHRVQQLTTKGQLLSEVSDWLPEQIALGQAGKFFVPTGSARLIRVFSQPAKPEATTEAPSGLKLTEATLNGTVNPSGEDAKYWFEYGKTAGYGSKAPATPKSTGWGAEPETVSQTLAGLARETVYHYRVVAENEEGTAYGQDKTFATPAPTPTNILDFGSKGSNDGQFAEGSVGVAVDTSGNVWVADAELSRIQKFNDKGEFLLKVGSFGSGDGQFKSPLGMATTSNGDLLVADSGNHRIQRFDSNGKYLSKFGTEGTGDGKFLTPTDVAVAPDGSIWVCDYTRHDVQKFDASGKFILKSGSKGGGDGQFLNPWGISTDAGANLWVVDREANRIQELSPTGAFLAKFGSEGSGPGQLNGPTDVAVKPNGTLIVSDQGNHRIQNLTPDGYFLAGGEQANPQFLALGRGGKLFVPDAASSTVRVWSQPAKPEVATNAPIDIETTEVTLNATVNPGGAETTYWFQWGETTSYGKNAPTTPKSVGSGNYPVALSETISGLAEETVYHYRVVAENGEGTTYGEDATFTTRGPSRLEQLPVVESFDGSSASLERFANDWSALGWAAGGTPKGQDTSAGWGPANSYPTVNGAYYEPTLTDSGSGVGVVATLKTAPLSASHYFSLWLDASGGKASRNGYELKFTLVSSAKYDVTLSKWVEGSKTPLASKSGYSFNAGYFGTTGSVGLVDKGGTVTAWTKLGANSFTELLSASDSAFSSGNAALEGAGNATRLKDFKAGALQPVLPKATTEAATAVKGAEVTLNATVNPRGRETKYRFQWGTDTSYGNNAPSSSGKSIGSGNKPVAVSETLTGLTEETLYHYRVVAESSEGTTYGKDMTVATTGPIGLNALPVVETFDGGSASLERFANDWSALGWAAGGTPKGQDTSTGWGPLAASPTVNGAYYEPTLTDSGTGVGVAATIGTQPGTAGHYFSLWLDASGSKASRSGYEMRFTFVSSWKYDVTLSKWVEGSQTVLASKSGQVVVTGQPVGLADKGGTVSAWAKTGSKPLTELLNASDSAFSSGNAGLEGAGNVTRLKNFKAGALG